MSTGEAGHFAAEDAAHERARLINNVRNGTHLDGLVVPPLHYAVPGLIPEGFTILCGAPKVGKSWLVLDIALAVALGGKALGGQVAVEGGRVLYLAFEDSERRLQQRARHLLGGDCPIPERFEYLTALAEPNRLADTLRAWLAANPDARLIIVDTLGRIMPPAPNGTSTYLHEYRVGAALKAVADERRVAMVAPHHERKAGADDWLDQVSGTNGLAGSADTVILLDRGRGKADGVLKVTGRDVAEREYTMTTVAGTWVLTDEAPVPLDLGDRSVAVVRYVAERPEGVRPEVVDSALDLGGQAKVYLTRLARSGHIRKLGRGLYGPVTSVTSVTSLDDEVTQVGGIHLTGVG